MKARPLDPQRLDVEIFARDAMQAGGEWPLVRFERLRDLQVAGSDVSFPVQWSARGEWRTARVGEAEIWLHLEASTRLWLQCQRCLQPVETPVAVDRSIRFVRGEEEAATLDADLDDDVLALPRALDLRELIEDELLLALPLVPRHEQCPAPLIPPIDEPPAGEERANPFAVLAGLRGKGGG
jgi:uncharacterized protein